MSVLKINNALNNKLSVNSNLNKVIFEKNMIGVVGKINHKKKWCTITASESNSYELNSVVEEKINNINDFEKLIRNNKLSNLSAIMKKKQKWCVVTSSSYYVMDLIYLNKNLKHKKEESKPEPKKEEPKPKPKKEEPKPESKVTTKLPWRERQKLLNKK
jgi:hypothetical protein